MTVHHIWSSAFQYPPTNTVTYNSKYSRGNKSWPLILSAFNIIILLNALKVRAEGSTLEIINPNTAPQYCHSPNTVPNTAPNRISSYGEKHSSSLSPLLPSEEKGVII